MFPDGNEALQKMQAALSRQQKQAMSRFTNKNIISPHAKTLKSYVIFLDCRGHTYCLGLPYIALY